MDPNYASYTYYFMKTYIVGILEKLAMCFHGEIKKKKKPASAAQLDALPTGDQEVVGLTRARSVTSFRGDFIMKCFLRSISLFRCFKKGSCQFLAKECAQFWLTA